MSRLAQAGLSSTLSPLCAWARHQAVAASSVSWDCMGTPVPCSAAAICGPSRPIRATARAAQDQHQLGRRAVGAQAGDGSHGGADIGALGIVEEVDAVHADHMLDAMRLAAVLAQAMQHRRQRATGRAGQGQGGQRIGGVVTSAHAQGIGRHQALQGDLFVLVVNPATFLPLDRLVELAGAYQPGHARFLDQAE
eukprot:Opistho-2@84365